MKDEDLPDFLMPLRSVEVAIPPPMILGAGGAAGNQKIVANVQMSGQEQTNWCWSAVTQSVKRWSGTQATQTEVASAHIAANGRPQTCDPPNGSESNGRNCATGDGCAAMCNDPHILSVVLKENALFTRYVTQGAAPTFNAIVAVVNNNKPVPCRVQWPTGGGHFILVIGWTVDETGANLVHVLDPASGSAGQDVPERVLGFNQFVGAYTLSGVSGSINYCYEV